MKALEAPVEGFALQAEEMEKERQTPTAHLGRVARGEPRAFEERQRLAEQEWGCGVKAVLAFLLIEPLANGTRCGSVATINWRLNHQNVGKVKLSPCGFSNQVRFIGKCAAETPTNQSCPLEKKKNWEKKTKNTVMETQLVHFLRSRKTAPWSKQLR